jgi:hypothetical protein
MRRAVFSETHHFLSLDALAVTMQLLRFNRCENARNSPTNRLLPSDAGVPLVGRVHIEDDNIDSISLVIHDALTQLHRVSHSIDKCTEALCCNVTMDVQPFIQ